MSALVTTRGLGMDLRGWSLVALCCVLTAVLAFQLNRAQIEVPGEPTASPETAQGDASSAASAVGQLTIEPLERYREISDRPLFHASRRPVPQDTSDTAAAAATELRQLTLVGVLISPETRLAIFRDKGPQALRLEAGATVGKWSVEDVREDGVTLRRGSETHVIPLHKVESAQWSSSDGERQATTAQSVARADVSTIQSQKAPTREQRFRKRRGL